MARLRTSCGFEPRVWDPLAVLNAVEGDDLFSLGEPGTVELTPDARTAFVPTPGGNCRRQLPGDAAWNAAMLEKIRLFKRMR